MTHTPKTAALEAYKSGLLSEASIRHLERHLQSCEVCQGELATMREYDALRAKIQLSKPDVDWSRMEFSLAREARTQAAARSRKTHPMWRVSAMGLVAVAAASLLWMNSNASEIPARPEPTRVIAIAPVQAARAPMRGVVAMRVGMASHEGVELSVSTALEGGTVETGQASQLHAQLFESNSGTPDRVVGALSLGAFTTLAIVAPDASEEEANILLLTRGRVTVESFHSESRIVVLAGGYRVVVEAARCTIELSGDGVRIAASSEGRVLIDGEALVAESGATTRHWGVDTSLELNAFTALTDGPVLSMSRPNVVRFDLDGVAISGGPSLALHVTADHHHVRAFDAQGHVYEANITVGIEGLALTPDALEPRRARLEGYLSPEEITPVVRGSQRALQHCYEQALRLQPELGGTRVVARVSLDSAGAVRRIRLGNPDVPASVEACITQEATQWHFPSPGGPMSFELPLRFATTTGR